MRLEDRAEIHQAIIAQYPEAVVSWWGGSVVLDFEVEYPTRPQDLASFLTLCGDHLELVVGAIEERRWYTNN